LSNKKCDECCRLILMDGEGYCVYDMKIRYPGDTCNYKDDPISSIGDDQVEQKPLE
jgi:hypothetical protein